MDFGVGFERLPSIAALGSLRDDYLDGLLAGQDGLVEVLVQSGEAWLARAEDGSTAAYFVVHDGVVVEFHVAAAFVSFAQEIFPAIVARPDVRAALVKSFDPFFLSNALDHQIGVRVKGYLVRDYLFRTLPAGRSVEYTRRIAVAGDLERVKAVQQDVFAHPERLRGVIERGQMHLFEQGETLIGFVIERRLFPDRPTVELGLAVDAPLRQKNYAIHMLRDVTQDCLARGLEPVSGCAFENRASVNMGRRIGYVTRHRLLEIRFR